MNKKDIEKFYEILVSDSELANKYAEFIKVLEEKFGKDSQMYSDSINAFRNVMVKGYAPGIPEPYRKYWQPYKIESILYHITIKKNVEAIKLSGLEPRDPFPRPWAGMKAVFMGEPKDPLYARSAESVLEHVRQKGEQPVLITIKSRNKLYKSVEPKRTFQVLSLGPITPKEIIGYKDL